MIDRLSPLLATLFSLVLTNVALADPFTLDCQTDDGKDWAVWTVDLDRKTISSGPKVFGVTLIEDDVILGMGQKDGLPSVLILHRYTSRFEEFTSARLCIPVENSDCAKPQVVTWNVRGECSQKRF